jgi:hypothetical protein
MSSPEVASSEVAAEVAAAWPDWHVWITRERKSVVATRLGPQQPAQDDRWARTVIADDWDELQQALIEQRQYDAGATRG